MSQKKIIAGRISKHQKMQLVELMKANRRIGCGQFFGPDSNKKAERVWKDIAEQLNASGGANKSWEQWWKSWADWKGAVKKQYTAIKRFNNKTGNLPETDGPRPIEGLDLEVINFFAIDAVEGDNSTREGGYPEEVTTNINSSNVTIADLDDEEVTTNMNLSIEVLDDVEVIDQIQQSNKSATVGRSFGGSINSELQKVKEQYEKRQERQEALLSEILAEVKNINKNFCSLMEVIKNK